jgi:hypothetical protein
MISPWPRWVPSPKREWPRGDRQGVGVFDLDAHPAVPVMRMWRGPSPWSKALVASSTATNITSDRCERSRYPTQTEERNSQDLWIGMLRGLVSTSSNAIVTLRSGGTAVRVAGAVWTPAVEFIDVGVVGSKLCAWVRWPR